MATMMTLAIRTAALSALSRSEPSFSSLELKFWFGSGSDSDFQKIRRSTPRDNFFYRTFNFL